MMGSLCLSIFRWSLEVLVLMVTVGMVGVKERLVMEMDKPWGLVFLCGGVVVSWMGSLCSIWTVLAVVASWMGSLSSLIWTVLAVVASWMGFSCSLVRSLLAARTATFMCGSGRTIWDVSSGRMTLSEPT